MRRAAVFCALALAGQASADDLIGAEGAWRGFEFGVCDGYVLDVDCMTAAGAPPGAIRFMQAAMADPEIALVIVPTRFIELGDVDLIEVTIPGLANTNSQQMLVNGDPPIYWLWDWQDHQPPDDSVTRAVLRRYPQAMTSGHITVVGHRILPEGGQRFVMADILTDGCRACAMIGDALFQMDFQGGTLVADTNLGWQLADFDQDYTPDYFARQLRSGDIALLQSMLNGRGYDAGPADGVVGRRTRAALAVFQSDHCLAVSDSVTAETITALVTRDDPFRVPPCAGRPVTEVASELALPIAPGRYAAEPRFCPGSPAYDGTAQFGDWLDVWQTGFGAFDYGCEVRSLSRSGDTLRLALMCQSEESGSPANWRVDLTEEGGFRLAFQSGTERTYSRCPVASAATFPLADPVARVNAVFGAAGPGPVADPTTYLAGQYHAAVDLRAAAGDEVRAPVAGEIVYVHRLNGAGQPAWMQSFVVLRDGSGRDWVFGHVACGICPPTPLIGDADAWPAQNRRPVAAGDLIGTVADLSPEGGATHLHLGLTTAPLVGSDGRLLPAFRAGSWARILYAEGESGAREAAAAQAAALGFIDPMAVLRRD